MVTKTPVLDTTPTAGAIERSHRRLRHIVHPVQKRLSSAEVAVAPEAKRRPGQTVEPSAPRLGQILIGSVPMRA